jgi:hypothetical protein
MPTGIRPSTGCPGSAAAHDTAGRAAKRLGAGVAAEQNILLIGCDQGCYEREIDAKLVDGAVVGSFPNPYADLGGSMPGQVITL